MLTARFLSAAFILLASGDAATLLRLSLGEMTARSTQIVRGTAVPDFVARQGSILYTHYKVTVAETWKGGPASTVDVAAPGGTLGGERQSYAGAAHPGRGEYVFFLWRSPHGLNLLMGLSQGMFAVERGGGEAMASRPAAGGRMLDARTGRAVEDEPLRMSLRELRERVLRGGAAAQ